MSGEKLRKFLNSNNIKYDSIMHSLAYTAQEIAASSHISAKELAKTVIVKIDGELAMIVMPSHHKVNLDELREVTGGKEVMLASEYEFQEQMPDCEVGAMPPFGNLYEMDVFVSSDLAKDESIAFNAGSHSELIRMSFDDYKKLVHPKIIRLSH